MTIYNDGIMIRKEANNIYNAAILACKKAESISESAYNLAYLSLTDARVNLIDVEIRFLSKKEIDSEYKTIKHRNRHHND